VVKIKSPIFKNGRFYFYHRYNPAMKTLQTERLTIRPFTEDDAPFVLELLNDPSFIENIGDRKVRSEEDARAYIRRIQASYENHQFGLSPVILNETQEKIGMCGLIKRPALDDPDVGYAFLPRFWSKGYAIESVLAVIQDGKTRLGLKRLVAIVDPKNHPSLRVLEHAGLTYEKMVQLPNDPIELKLLSIML